MKNLYCFQYASRDMFDFLSIQSFFDRLLHKVVLKVPQSNGYRSRGFLYLVKQGSKMRSTILKAFEHIAFVFHSWVTFNAFNYHRFLRLVSSDCELQRKGIRSLGSAHVANQTVSWISFVIVYFPSLPLRTCPIRKTDDIIKPRLLIEQINSRTT